MAWRFFDADRVVAFAPGACLGPEPGRNEVPGPAPAGRDGRGGVQEVRLQRGRPGPVQAGGFLDDDPGVLPGDRPGLQGRQGQRQPGRQGQGIGQQGCGGPFADGQDAGDLGDQRHFLGGAFLRVCRRRCQGPGGPRVVGDQLRLQRGGPSLQPGDLGEPVQAVIRPTRQRIGLREGIEARRIGGVSARTGQGNQHSSGRGNGRHGGPALRTQRCTEIHTHSIPAGTDNHDGTGRGAERRPRDAGTG